MSLTSDGLTRAKFLLLWRDALWHAGLEERARLTLELGRATVREEGKASVLVVAIAEGRDEPVVVMPLADAPHTQDPARPALIERLATLGADEVYVTMTIQTASASDGTPALLLAVWGEAADGRETCWLMPFRWSRDGLEEAEPMMAPAPDQTVFSRQLRGLLSTRH